MGEGRKQYGPVLSAAVFVILEIAAIIMLSRSSSLQDIWVNRAAHRVHASIWGGGERVRNYFKLEKQNRELAAENVGLSALARELSQKDLARSQGAMFDSSVGNFRYTPATIVKASRNSQHNYIILDKGYEDGIKPQTGIITANGVVGTVSIVDRHFSYGITLMNNRMSVASRIGRTGPVAPLEWDGRSSNGALLRNLPLHYEIAPGDTVWTSGYSQVFPPDIPIGVTGKVRLIDGSVNDVSVRLFQDFSALRYVIITENLDRGEIAGLEEEALQ